MRGDLADMSIRVQTLEKQVGPLIELRLWVIGGGLTVLALVGVAVVKLVMRMPI
jgi:hypothetical protein